MTGNNGEKENLTDTGSKPTPEEYGLELGVEFNLPFITPYNDGLSKKQKEDKELYELLHADGLDHGPTISQLVAMRRLDGQARALYRLLTLPIRAALTKSTFVPADGGEAEAEFIDLQFNLPPASGGMSVTFHKFMAQLLQALFDGFAPFEQVYDYADFGPLKGKYVLRKLGYRQPDTITIIEDEDGHFQGFRQRAYRAGKVVDVHIPRDRAFYYAAQEEERKYYGVSFFQSAFYHYDKKSKIYFLAHLAAQRSAVGTRVGSYPVNASQTDRRIFTQNLSNLSVAQWMTIPENFKVEMLKESGGFSFLDYINHHDNQMSKSILANFFDKDTGGGAGDAKLVSFGQPGDSMFVLMLRAIMDDIANQINHYIIPRLIDWNFSGGKYPKFQWAELTDEQKAAIQDSFDKLSVAGQASLVSPEFIRELEKKMADEMGLEIDWDEVEKREAQDKINQNLQQGLDANGQPLPLDASGNPIRPGQQTPDQQIQAFEQQNSSMPSSAPASAPTPAPGPTPPGTSPTNKKKTNVPLSSVEDDLLDMAAELIELARPAGERYVRTEQGAKRYGKSIGDQITRNEQTGGEGNQVTVVRLQSLKSQYDGFVSTGDKTHAMQTMKQLRRAVFEYTGSWKPSDFIKTMNKIGKGNKPKAPKKPEPKQTDTPTT